MDNVQMKTVTYAEAKSSFASLLDSIIEDRKEIAITRSGGESVVMVAQGEWDAIQTTLHLQASPHNAARLQEAIAELDADSGWPQ